MNLPDSWRRAWRRLIQFQRRNDVAPPPEPEDSMSMPRSPIATGPLSPPPLPPELVSSEGIQSISYRTQAPGVATIRADLAQVNLRIGPGLQFDRLERVAGGTVLSVLDRSDPDFNGHAWLRVAWDFGDGWVRADLVELGGEATKLPASTPFVLPEIAWPDGIDDRWPLPLDTAISHACHRLHVAVDMAAPVAMPIKASAPGEIIRAMTCAHCEDVASNITPGKMTLAERRAVLRDPAWGFGWGNFLVIRHDYNVLPEPLKHYMDQRDLTDGYAYIQYAHLSQIVVQLGLEVSAGAVLALTGETGLVSAPHLHMEVKIGRTDSVDGKWLEQEMVPPSLLFAMPEGD